VLFSFATRRKKKKKKRRPKFSELTREIEKSFSSGAGPPRATDIGRTSPTYDSFLLAIPTFLSLLSMARCSVFETELSDSRFTKMDKWGGLDPHAFSYHGNS
jgi:hypothetical protein